MDASSPPPYDNDKPGEDPVPRSGEFYYDGPFLVFTEAYHLRRGYCCQSGCRHCPYGFEQQPKAEK